MNCTKQYNIYEKKRAIAFNEDGSFHYPITLNLNFFLETFVYFQHTASSVRLEYAKVSPKFQITHCSHNSTTAAV